MAKILNAFFTSVFMRKIYLQEFQVPENRGEVWSKEDLSLVEEHQVREHLNQPDAQKSMGPDGMQP